MQETPDVGPVVARLCDRRLGVGGDGVLRVVRTADAGEPVPGSDGCEWFMDYRNADGSAAQMCGNGIRCVAKYAFEHGLSKSNPTRIETDAGVRRWRYPMASPGSAAPLIQEFDLEVDLGDAKARRVEAGLGAAVHSGGGQITVPADMNVRIPPAVAEFVKRNLPGVQLPSPLSPPSRAPPAGPRPGP